MSLWGALGAFLRRLQTADSPDSASAEPPMKLVVGLGNPGAKYAGTRHNIGYAVVDRIASALPDVVFRKQFSGKVASARVGGERILLVKPETYMNESGRCVQPALAFYRLPTQDLLVICDDLNLPVGKIRLRRGGSDGGQKGLRSIARHLGTDEFPRLRVGVGAVPPGRDAADYVLDRFARDELDLVREASARAAEAVNIWCSSGIEECMNRFN